jgi:hypothetical protein
MQEEHRTKWYDLQKSGAQRDSQLAEMAANLFDIGDSNQLNLQCG